MDINSTKIENSNCRGFGVLGFWNEVEDSNDNSGSDDHDEENKNENKPTGRRKDDLEFYQRYKN